MLTGLALDLLAEGEVPRLDLGRCLRARFSRTSCQRCAAACPAGAVRVAMGPPAVDPDRCTGCRSCEASCPTGALGDPDALERAAQELRGRERPVLGCRAPGVKADARLACLGGLDEEALLALGTAFPGGLTLDLTACGSCASGAIVPRLRAALARAAAVPGATAGRLRLAETAADRDEEEELTRRQFFSIFRRRSSSAAGEALRRIDPAAPEPYAAKRLPRGRRLLLRATAAGPAALREEVARRYFPAAEFGPACRGCTGCAGICPTGALSTDDGEPPRPVFDASACTRCGACAEFCRRGALAIVPS